MEDNENGIQLEENERKKDEKLIETGRNGSRGGLKSNETEQPRI